MLSWLRYKVPHKLNHIKTTPIIDYKDFFIKFFVTDVLSVSQTVVNFTLESLLSLTFLYYHH